jgi:RHS repeat-associated protein
MKIVRTVSVWTMLFAALTLLLTFAATAHATQSITYYHWDALGSPVAASDEAGNLKWREQYQPYGERLQNQTAAQANTRWYTGHPHDNATGLTYMGARWYDPAVGRFMSVDPKAFIESNLHSFNRYNYANNNPYKYTDPDGKAAQAYTAVGTGVLLIGGYIYVTGSPEQRAQIDRAITWIGERASDRIRSQTGLIFNEGKESTGAGSSEPPVPGATPGRETKGRTTQWEKPGGMPEANKDFDDKGPKDVVDLPGGGRTGTLPDGRPINVRPNSKDGRPTLEIQSGKNRDKVRYDP